MAKGDGRVSLPVSRLAAAAADILLEDVNTRKSRVTGNGDFSLGETAVNVKLCSVWRRSLIQADARIFPESSATRLTETARGLFPRLFSKVPKFQRESRFAGKIK